MGDGTLSETASLVAGSASFTGDPGGFAAPQATGGVDFVLPAKATDTVLAGVPQLDLVVSATAPRVHVIANLYDESPTGVRRRISQFAINPELRNSADIEAPDKALFGEGFRLSQPAPGHYRHEVHNWAGAPATRVDVTMTFLNSAYKPGPDPPAT